jgi:hypothetical protein
MYQQNPRDPRRGNQPGDYSQMAPYRDGEEDDQANVMAQAIAPARPAQPQPQQAAPPPDVSQPQRAALQQPQARTGLSGRQGSDGSLSSMTGGNTGGNTGITGGGLSGRQILQAPSAPAMPGSLSDLTGGNTGINPTAGALQELGGSMSAAAPQRPTSVGQYGNRLEGFDGGKLQDPNKHDPKYDFARVASQFDPTQGLTPEMLQQLNGLGYGTFSGQNDKLHVDNGDPMFNGISDFDVARDYGQGGWQWAPEGGQGADPMQAALGASSPEEEQYAQAMGIDTSNPLWRQIFEQLQAEALGTQGNLSNDMYYQQY